MKTRISITNTRLMLMLLFVALACGCASHIEHRPEDRFQKASPPPSGYILLYISQNDGGRFSYYVDDTRFATLNDQEYTWIYVKVTPGKEQMIMARERGFLRTRKIWFENRFIEGRSYHYSVSSNTRPEYPNSYNPNPGRVLITGIGSASWDTLKKCYYVRPEVEIIDVANPELNDKAQQEFMNTYGAGQGATSVYVGDSDTFLRGGQADYYQTSSGGETVWHTMNTVPVVTSTTHGTIINAQLISINLTRLLDPTNAILSNIPITMSALNNTNYANYGIWGAAEGVTFNISAIVNYDAVSKAWVASNPTFQTVDGGNMVALSTMLSNGDTVYVNILNGEGFNNQTLRNSDGSKYEPSLGSVAKNLGCEKITSNSQQASSLKVSLSVSKNGELNLTEDAKTKVNKFLESAEARGL
ncbi:MAG: hypothetical protein ABIF87_05620 [Pseudomonadota bacterium]